MKALFLLVILFASCFGSVHDEAMSYWNEKLSRVPNFHSKVANMMESGNQLFSSVQARGDTPPTPCLDALVATELSGCFPNSTQADDGTFNPATAKVCTSACDAVFASLYSACSSYLTNSDVAGFTFWRSLLCLKDGNGDYCYPLFQELPQSGQNLTLTSLNAVCSPCFHLLINIVIAWEGASIDEYADESFYFNLVCTKDNEGNFCFLEVQENGFYPVPQCLTSELDAFSFQSSCLDQFCTDSCAQRLLVKFWLFSGEGEYADFFRVLRILSCNKRPSDNSYCIQDFATDIAGVAENPSCSQARSIAADLQCCLGSIVDFLEVFSNDSAVVGGLLELASTCSITIPTPCASPPGTAILKAVFVISVDSSWAQSPAAQEALQQDLAAFFGVPTSSIVIVEVSSSKRDSGTSVSFTAQGDSDSDTQTFASQFNSQGSSIIFQATGKLYSQTYPGQAVQVTNVQSATVVSTSSASFLGSGILALVAALIVLLL